MLLWLVIVMTMMMRRKRKRRGVMLLCLLALSGLPSTRGGCDQGACNPRMGNLALGRPLMTQTVCGYNTTEAFCWYGEKIDAHALKHSAANLVSSGKASESLCGTLQCGKCNAARPHQSHLASDMSDSSFRHPNTWWQSAEGVATETVQLNLETEFYLTHLILVFRSPRPAALVLERSPDYGKTWTTLQLYARDCDGTFGVPEGDTCTQKYSAGYPCTRGEVIFRALSPWNTLDPYSSPARARLTLTNLRVRLLQHQPCPCQLKEARGAGGTAGTGDKAGEMPVPGQHFAIYDFIAKGSCLCNGHADQCVPAPGYQPSRDRTNHVVHGRCVCRHHTAGAHCERCAPLYNDQPWQPANGLTGAPNECKKCKCNGHAESCRFDVTVWLSSGLHSGGVCDCTHNTEGPNCQRCKAGFYRDPHRPHAAPDSCRPCECDPKGSVATDDGGGAFCDHGNGECVCKPGVGGPQCDRCRVGYWGFHDYGCKPCNCAGDCDPYTGDCVALPDLEVPQRGNSSELFRVEELFSALRSSEKCVCKEPDLGNSKIFCTMKYDYIVKVKVVSAHDKGSHAEVLVKLRKVLWRSSELRPKGALWESSALRLERGTITLYPESWTARGCTCPVLYPGVEYLVAGHSDRKKGRLLVNMKSFVKRWTTSLGRKVLHVLKHSCA
ncbi:netrin-4 [Alosa pseudoharengus]|uniref:netrin-4 n=1 Tax=Alosa pseudoharengus TaxID=34774 RepID=UPI003F88F174